MLGKVVVFTSCARLVYRHATLVKVGSTERFDPPQAVAVDTESTCRPLPDVRIGAKEFRIVNATEFYIEEVIVFSTFSLTL